MLLRILFDISKYCRFDFYKTCHHNLGKWFANLYYDMIKKKECDVSHVAEYRLDKVPIAGGHHSTPAKGFYIHIVIYELDVKGQYPNIVRKYNLSFETVCCDCCKYDPKAWIPQEIIDVINEQLRLNGIDRKVERYRVCQKQNTGAFPKVVDLFLADRDRYKKLLKDEESKPNPNKQLTEEYNAHQIAAKILANAGAGLFGEKHFDFSNYKVNELITGIGRWIHKKMEQVGQKDPYNFKVMFGFTDSAYFSNVANEELLNQFVKHFKDKLDVDIEIKNKYVNSIFYDEKNRSVTGNPKDEPVIKGLNGDSDSDCLWVRKWFRQVIIQIVKEPDSRFEIIPAILQRMY